MLINYISARSAPQVLSIKGECISSANSLFDIFSFLTADLFRVAKVSERASVAATPEDFLTKNYKPLKQDASDF